MTRPATHAVRWNMVAMMVLMLFSSSRVASAGIVEFQYGFASVASWADDFGIGEGDLLNPAPTSGFVDHVLVDLVWSFTPSRFDWSVHQSIPGGHSVVDLGLTQIFTVDVDTPYFFSTTWSESGTADGAAQRTFLKIRADTDIVLFDYITGRDMALGPVNSLVGSLHGILPAGSSIQFATYAKIESDTYINGLPAHSGTAGGHFSITFSEAVPEPSSLTLLALGSTGAISGYRRKLRRTKHIAG